MPDFERAQRYALHRLELELPPGLYYHSLSHTAHAVVPAAATFAHGEGLTGEARDLLLTAAWFHDLGFIEVRAGHEAVGARFASEALPAFGYTQAQIATIQRLIVATAIPQAPGTLLEQILADADVDGLGRADFMACNRNLRRELAFFGRAFTDQEWYAGQLQFVAAHTYFTPSARALRTAGQSHNAVALKHQLWAIRAEP